ncbi:MAG: hypothetical protein ABEJ28_04140 [Salinigranum sp.]
MGVETAFRTLADALDRLDGAGLTVREVTTPEQDLQGEGTFLASVSVACSVFDGAVPGGGQFG